MHPWLCWHTKHVAFLYEVNFLTGHKLFLGDCRKNRQDSSKRTTGHALILCILPSFSGPSRWHNVTGVEEAAVRFPQVLSQHLLHIHCTIWGHQRKWLSTVRAGSLDCETRGQRVARGASWRRRKNPVWPCRTQPKRETFYGQEIQSSAAHTLALLRTAGTGQQSAQQKKGTHMHEDFI